MSKARQVYKREDISISYCTFEEIINDLNVVAMKVGKPLSELTLEINYEDDYLETYTSWYRDETDEERKVREERERTRSASTLAWYKKMVADMEAKIGKSS